MVRNFPSWLGRLLRNLRPGIGKTLIHHQDFATTSVELRVESSAFGTDGSISQLHTDDGNCSSPPLCWTGIPSNAMSLALVVEDADSPTPSPFVHLLAWDLPARDNTLATGYFKSKGHAGTDDRLGRNGLGKCEYTPPDPLPGHGPHHYVFQLFALDIRLEFATPPNRLKLQQAMLGHVLAKGEVIGTYTRP